MQNFDFATVLPAILAVAAVFMALPGLSLLISTLVNTFKFLAQKVGLSFDGYSGKLASVLQLVAFLGLVSARVMAPAVDLFDIDVKFKLVAEFLISASVFAAQLGLQEPIYQLIRNKLPVIGSTFTFNPKA